MSSRITTVAIFKLYLNILKTDCNKSKYPILNTVNSALAV